jgi:error-prone DNA polymerase
MPLFDGVVDDEPAVGLPVMTPFEQVVADYRATGLSLKGHPMGFYRDDLTKLKAIPAEQLTTIPHGRSVTVGGIVIMRQRPSTAKGVTFVTLEDETGIANLVVHQSTWEKYYTIARRSPAWLAHGTLERKDAVIHVLIRRLEDLSAKLGELRMKSRDFR